MTDATLEGSEKLVARLKKINNTAKELKKEQLALDIRIHEDNLRYKQEKNKMKFENSRLALQNQSAVVVAMASMAEAIRSAQAPATSNTSTTAAESQKPSRADLPLGDEPATA